MGVIQRVPWTVQPQVAARVDRGNPLGAKLRYASTLGPNLLDAATGAIGTPSGNPLVVPGTRGLAMDFVPASSQFVTLPTRNIVSGYPLTVAAWIRWDVYSTTGYIAYSLVGTGYAAILGVSAFNASYLNVNIGSAPSQESIANAAFPVGTWHHYVSVHRSGSWVSYVDGQLQTQTLTQGNWGEPAAGNHAIGQRLNGASPRYMDGGVQDLYVFQGELTAAEAFSLYQNHYQVFAPLARKIWVPVSAGGAYTVTADVAAYTLAAQDAALVKSRIVAADAAAYALAAQDANVLRGRVVVADASSYALAAQDATLLRGRVVTADSAAYVFAGQDATLTYTPSGSTYTLVCDAAAYALAGQDANLLRGRIVSADAGAYSIVGQDADLRFSGAANISTGGGVPAWNPYARTGETEEQKKTRRLAQGIIARAKKPNADVEKLATQAKRVSQALQDDARGFEAEAAYLQQQLLIGAAVRAKLMQAQNDALATRQLEQRMIAAQLQAEFAWQQVEELDVVFMAVMLAALE